MAHTNLADPDYEPSDEDLAHLVAEAFAGVHHARERDRAEMWRRIGEIRRQNRSRYAEAIQRFRR